MKTNLDPPLNVKMLHFFLRLPLENLFLFMHPENLFIQTLCAVHPGHWLATLGIPWCLTTENADTES